MATAHYIVTERIWIRRTTSKNTLKEIDLCQHDWVKLRSISKPMRVYLDHHMSINTLMQVNVEAPSECMCTVCVAQRSPRLGMQHRADALLTRYFNCTYKGLSLYKFAAKTAQVWLSKPPLDFVYVGRVKLG